MISPVKIVGNTLVQGQGTNGFLAPRCYDGSSNPTIQIGTPIFRFGGGGDSLVPKVNVIVGCWDLTSVSWKVVFYDLLLLIMVVNKIVYFT